MPLKYSDYVDYSKLDPVKRMALELFESTLHHPRRLGIKIISETLGEPSVGFDFSDVGKDFFVTFNVEGLGTKNRIADTMYKEVLVEKKKVANAMEMKGLYRGLGQDTCAMSINDQLSIGADTFAYNDIISCGNSSWFSDNTERVRELLLGYKEAADIGKFAIPQGETPELRDVVNPETLDLAGASLGLVKPRKRLTTGAKIKEGDFIYGLQSSGIHSNGLSKARKIAEKLPDGYFTKLSDESTLGESLLKPTVLYTRAVMRMFERGVDIHYLQPITGHGWAKIARARMPFKYVIKDVPEPPLLFGKLIEGGAENGFDVSPKENYFTWNMGVGYVVIAPKEEGKDIQEVAYAHMMNTHKLGYVAKGGRQVVMPFEDGNGRKVVYLP